MQNAHDANAGVLQLKEFQRDALYRPSDKVFTIIRHIETLFYLRATDLMECTNAVVELEEGAMLLDSNLLSCHDVEKNHLHIRQADLRIAASVYRGHAAKGDSSGVWQSWSKA